MSQKILSGQIATQNAIIAQRDVEIHRIAKGVSEVHQMMNEIKILTDYQGELLDNIENNLDSAVVDLKVGASELKVAQQNQSSCCLQ
jgi:t-SNARE complex subunit (syntaxin)